MLCNRSVVCLSMCLSIGVRCSSIIVTTQSKLLQFICVNGSSNIACLKFATKREKKNTMSNLWSKENRKRIKPYVDLFEDVLEDDQFKQWDRELNSANWMHQFLEFKKEAKKHELTSKKFNDEGDALFQRKLWRKAMEFYDRSLCFAPVDSKRMSILFAKRGFCFFNMEMYNNSLNDIEFALGMDHPQEIAATLYESRDNSIQMISKKSQRVSIVPALSFEADDKIPCMANVLELKRDAENVISKPYFVAKTDINVGQIVLSEEAFISIAVGYDRMFCFTCLATVKSFIPCTKCTDVMFCDDDCRDRNIVHQISCGDAYHRMPSFIKFIVQSILEAITSFAMVDDLMNFVSALISCKSLDSNITTNSKVSKYALFFSLPRSSHELPLLLIYKVYTTLLAMKFIKSSFNTSPKQRFLMHLIGHHVQVLACNSEGGFEKEQNQFISATMTNVASMFEHSCTPNLLKCSVNNRTIFVTIQPVKVDDHLSIDYWPDDDDIDAAERNKLLRNNYGIYCRCEKCNPRSSIIESKLWEDPSFFFVKDYQEYLDNQTSLLLKKKCEIFLEKHKDHLWSKEKDIVIKIYTQCLLNEFERENNENLED